MISTCLVNLSYPVSWGNRSVRAYAQHHSSSIINQQHYSSFIIHHCLALPYSAHCIFVSWKMGFKNSKFGRSGILSSTLFTLHSRLHVRCSTKANSRLNRIESNQLHEYFVPGRSCKFIGVSYRVIRLGLFLLLSPFYCAFWMNVRHTPFCGFPCDTLGFGFCGLEWK